jgi:hypothetical protein
MSVQVKPGRWKLRNGGEAIVEENLSEHLSDKRLPWSGRILRSLADADICHVFSFWTETGRWSLQFESCWDLVEYLGPAEQTGGVS